MTKQEEWREKAKKEFEGEPGNGHWNDNGWSIAGAEENHSIAPLAEQLADFFYNLHLEEMEKVREMAKKLDAECAGYAWFKDGELVAPETPGSEKKEASYHKPVRDFLLAITDEK